MSPDSGLLHLGPGPCLLWQQVASLCLAIAFHDVYGYNEDTGGRPLPVMAGQQSRKMRGFLDHNMILTMPSHATHDHPGGRRSLRTRAKVRFCQYPRPCRYFDDPARVAASRNMKGDSPQVFQLLHLGCLLAGGLHVERWDCMKQEIHGWRRAQKVVSGPWLK